MKYLSWIALIISAIVVINELFWIGRSELALVLVGLGVSVVLLAAEQVTNKKV